MKEELLHVLVGVLVSLGRGVPGAAEEAVHIVEPVDEVVRVRV